MKRIFVLMIIMLAGQVSFAQDKYLEKGNQYLNNDDDKAAERVFREAIKSDSTNLIYQDQLALALMNQTKYKEAQIVINKVLLVDSTNDGALWYGGMNTFQDESADLRVAVQYFEKFLQHAKESDRQYYSANWFIGRSYQILLQTDGLTYNEVTRMLDCYSTYLRLQPQADDAATISAFVKHIKEIRPSDNVEKWINKTQ